MQPNRCLVPINLDQFYSLAAVEFIVDFLHMLQCLFIGPEGFYEYPLNVSQKKILNSEFSDLIGGVFVIKDFLGPGIQLRDDLT